MWYVFGDNEAVIKMIMIGRRSHNEVILDPKFKSVTLTPNTNSQRCWLKKIFTRDECTNLLHLFSITHSSSTCCTKNFSLRSCSTMAKRIRDQKEEERVVSKSRPAVMNMFSFIATSSSTASSPIASTSLVMPIASGKPDSKAWRVDGKARRHVASRRKSFRRFRQSCGWNMVLQWRTCCPKQ